MGVSILFICLFLASILFSSSLRSIRKGICASFVIQMGLMLLIAEVASTFHWFDPKTLAASWFLIGAVWIALVVITARKGLFQEVAQCLANNLRTLNRYEQFLAGSLVILILATGVIAANALPNNWDSLTYQLPRIIFWFQAHSLSHFPIDDYRLLYNPPLCAIFLANLTALSSHESAMNTAQWLAYIIVILQASLISKKLGADRTSQLEIAVLTATLPAFVLQASTTQSDLLTAALLFSSVSFLFPESSPGARSEWFLGLLSAGLSIAVKAVAFFFLPFLLLFPFWHVIRRRHYWATASFILILLPSIPWMARNYTLFQHPFGYHNDGSFTRQQDYYRNGYFSPSQAFGAIAKSMTLFTATPIGTINKAQENGVRAFHRLLNEDPDDPRLQWYSMKYHVPLTGPHEDAPPVFWHFFIAVGLGILTFQQTACRKKKITAAVFLFLCTAGFTATSIYVKWMPWNIRFLVIWLAFVITASAPVLPPVPLWLRRVIVTMCFIGALSFALFAMPRSILSFALVNQGQRVEFVSVFADDETRFCAARPDHTSGLRSLVIGATSEKPDTIGLLRLTEAALYPFMALTRKELPSVKFIFVGKNRSTDILSSNATITPPVIVALGAEHAPDIQDYTPTVSNAHGVLFIRKKN